MNKRCVKLNLFFLFFLVLLIAISNSCSNNSIEPDNTSDNQEVDDEVEFAVNLFIANNTKTVQSPNIVRERTSNPNLEKLTYNNFFDAENNTTINGIIYITHQALPYSIRFYTGTLTFTGKVNLEVNFKYSFHQLGGLIGVISANEIDHSANEFNLAFWL